MKTIATAASLGCLALVTAWGTSAKPLSITLPEDATEWRAGPQAGLDAAQSNCASCHSVDYVATQPPKKGKAFWEAEVAKMINVYHAPIDAGDAKAIAEYLAQAY